MPDRERRSSLSDRWDEKIISKHLYLLSRNWQCFLTDFQPKELRGRYCIWSMHIFNVFQICSPSLAYSLATRELCPFLTERCIFSDPLGHSRMWEGTDRDDVDEDMIVLETPLCPSQCSLSLTQHSPKHLHRSVEKFSLYNSVFSVPLYLSPLWIHHFSLSLSYWVYLRFSHSLPLASIILLIFSLLVLSSPANSNMLDVTLMFWRQSCPALAL